MLPQDTSSRTIVRQKTDDFDEPTPALVSPDSAEPKRQQWGNKMEFFLVLAGYAIGIGNLWRFPYMVGKYGGVFTGLNTHLTLRRGVPDCLLHLPCVRGRAAVLRRAFIGAAPQRDFRWVCMLTCCRLARSMRLRGCTRGGTVRRGLV